MAAQQRARSAADAKEPPAAGGSFEGGVARQAVAARAVTRAGVTCSICQGRAP